MALAINNNLMANNVTRNLQGHYNKLGKSTQRLSSGLRVNSAADDAAGLAIRELMRADVAALNQGVRNANDGISLIQTADGALGVIDSKLIRMKELAEQAATDTYTDAQRSIINEEYQAMADEITRIAEDTDFNGKKLLNTGGSLSAGTMSDAGATGTVTSNADGSYGVAEAGGTTGDNTVTLTSTSGSLTEVTTYTSTNSGGGTGNNNFTINANGSASSIGTQAVTIDKASTIDLSSAASVTFETRSAGGEWQEVSSLPDGAKGNGNDLRVTVTKNDGNIESFIFDTEATTELSTTYTAGTSLVVNAEQVSVAGGGNTDSASSNTTLGDARFNIHFGSSSASTDSYDVTLGKTTAEALGVGAAASDDVSTTAKAKAALDNITDAIEKKDSIRATLGATQNRLEATIENVSIQKENLQAAESRISDVDVATEMTEFSKQQILANAAVSMLSQANNLPQMAQKLIG